MTVLLVEQLAADGRLRSGREALRDLERRVGEAVELDFRVDTFAQIADEQGISDARLQAELRAAMRVLAAERVRYEGIVFSAGADPDGGATFTVLINIQGNLRDEMRLEAKLGEVLADFPEWNPCELSVEFQRAASQDARQPA